MKNETMDVIPLSAVTLTPFYYHGLYAPDGSATHPQVITDTALVFALRAALLGSPMPRRMPDYRADLDHIPWRASLLMGTQNTLMAPVRHTIDLSREGGFTEKMQHNLGSGNFKTTFFVHEVAIGSRYEGLLVGPDPFKTLGTEEIIVRVGVGRQGMLVLTRYAELGDVVVNTATSALFGRPLKEQYRLLDTIRVSRPFTVEDAAKELSTWWSEQASV